MIKTIGIILAAFLIVGIMFSGVALAAQTSFNLSVTGNVFVDEKYQSQIHNGLPYAGESYYHNTVMVNALDTTYAHATDTAYGLETATTLKYSHNKDRMLSSVLVDESFSKSVIASSPGTENSSDTRCYSSGAGFRAMGPYLELESAAIVSDMDTAYAVTATGFGSMQYTASDYEASGDVNGMWVTSVSDEDVRAYGEYEFEGTAISEAMNFPATYEEVVEEEEEIEAEERLCPFSLGWG